MINTYNQVQFLFEYDVTDTLSSLKHQLEQSETLVKSCTHGVLYPSKVSTHTKANVCMSSNKHMQTFPDPQTHRYI